MYHHHIEPRVKLYSLREESFPIPLKYIDVTRTTHTNLDVKQEKRIDDYWNIDGSRDLSDPWTGFTQFTLLDKKAPDGYTWSRGRLTRKQLTSRPDHLWPASASGRVARFDHWRSAQDEDPSGDHAWIGSSRALNVDGRRAKGRPGGSQQGRPHSSGRTECDDHEGSRTNGRDDSSGNFRRRVSVSSSPQRGAVRSLLADMRTSRCIARYGFRGARMGEAAHPGPTHRLRRVAPTQPTVVDSSDSDERPLLSPQFVDGFDEDALLRVDSASNPLDNGRDVANQERTAQTGFKRLRLTRLSQATTVVASSGGERAELQEMSHIQDTMEDIDAELDDRGPGVAAFDSRREPPELAVTQRGSEGEGVEGPFLGVQSSVTVAPADPNAPGRVMGVAQVVDMATPRGQTHQEFAASRSDSCSDTDSVASMPRRRRLVLVSRDLDVQDSHEERVARVRHRMQNEHRTCAQQRLVRDFEEFFTSVVRRVVPTDADAGEIPRALCRQRWSVLNVPLMWAAACGDDQSAVQQWYDDQERAFTPTHV